MWVLLLICLAELAFADDVAAQNLKLRRTNKALLKALQTMTAERAVGDACAHINDDNKDYSCNGYYKNIAECAICQDDYAGAPDNAAINEDIEGCVPCVCNKHDSETKTYTECGPKDDYTFWRFGPEYINCYDPAKRQGKYEFKLFGSCPSTEKAVGVQEGDELTPQQKDKNEECKALLTSCETCKQDQGCAWSDPRGLCFGMAYLQSAIPEWSTSTWEGIIDSTEECGSAPPAWPWQERSVGNSQCAHITEDNKSYMCNGYYKKIVKCGLCLDDDAGAVDNSAINAGIRAREKAVAGDCEYECRQAGHGDQCRSWCNHY